MTYPDYTAAADAYDGRFRRETTAYLEARENGLLTLIGTYTTWKGSAEEVECAHIQAELRLREAEEVARFTS